MPFQAKRKHSLTFQSRYPKPHEMSCIHLWGTKQTFSIVYNYLNELKVEKNKEAVCSSQLPPPPPSIELCSKFLRKAEIWKRLSIFRFSRVNCRFVLSKRDNNTTRGECLFANKPPGYGTLAWLCKSIRNFRKNTKKQTKSIKDTKPQKRKKQQKTPPNKEQNPIDSDWGSFQRLGEKQERRFDMKNVFLFQTNIFNCNELF